MTRITDPELRDIEEFVSTYIANHLGVAATATAVANEVGIDLRTTVSGRGQTTSIPTLDGDRVWLDATEEAKDIVAHYKLHPVEGMQQTLSMPQLLTELGVPDEVVTEMAATPDSVRIEALKSRRGAYAAVVSEGNVDKKKAGRPSRSMGIPRARACYSLEKQLVDAVSYRADADGITRSEVVNRLLSLHHRFLMGVQKKEPVS